MLVELVCYWLAAVCWRDHVDLTNFSIMIARNDIVSIFITICAIDAMSTILQRLLDWGKNFLVRSVNLLYQYLRMALLRLSRCWQSRCHLQWLKRRFFAGGGFGILSHDGLLILLFFLNNSFRLRFSFFNTSSRSSLTPALGQLSLWGSLRLYSST